MVDLFYNPLHRPSGFRWQDSVRLCLYALFAIMPSWATTH